MIRVARNIRRKNFETTTEVREDNRRVVRSGMDKLREIEERLLELEKRSGGRRAQVVSASPEAPTVTLIIK